VNDPTLNMLKTTQAFVPGAWRSNPNTVIEENEYDLAHVNGAIHLKHSSSQKRRQKQYDQYQQFVQDHDACISKAISRNGVYHVQISQAQNDGGANRSVTNNKEILIKYENIPKYTINGVNDGEVAIYCTGRGYLPWRVESGELILIRCYYYQHTSGTIISPTDVNAQYTDRYHGWVMTTNLDAQTGTFQLSARDGVNHLRLPAYCENNLWYYYLNQITNNEYNRIGHNIKAVVKTLTNGASYELWHNRLDYPAQKVMEIIHKHVNGVPKLKRNKFYSYTACMTSKFRKKYIDTTKRSPVPDNKPQSAIKKGQHLSIDFGFVRGSDWSKRESTGKLLTSIDGFRSYCLIIDRATRYIWIILTKTKSPPVAEVKDLPTRLKPQVQNRYKTIY